MRKAEGTAEVFTEVFTIRSSAGHIVFLTNETIKSVTATLVTNPSYTVCFRQLKVSGIQLYLTLADGQALQYYVASEGRADALRMLDDIDNQIVYFYAQRALPTKKCYDSDTSSSDGSDSSDD
jgi:hypothetical protein